MRFGLKDETVDMVKGVFEKHVEIRRAVIYGSRAKGCFKEGSDIDISLFGDKMGFAFISRILSELDDLMLPYSFDISSYDEIANVELKAHIDRVGIVFYEKKKT